MSEAKDSRGVSKRKSNGKERGSNRISATWSHLDKDKREQYEAIERRIRDKVERGEL